MACKYTQAEDHELIDEVVVFNPFQRGRTWEGLKKGLKSPTLGKRSSKSLRDRALLLMSKRKDVVNHQQKS
jgi:hypothetical protein